MSRFLVLACLLCGLGTAHAQNSPITVGPAPCAQSTLLDALEIAKQRPGHDTIVLTESLSQQIVLVDDPAGLTLRGGTVDCNGALLGTITVSGKATSAALSAVFTGRGEGDLTLERLRITDGHGNVVAGDIYRRGGGVEYTGSGTLTLRDVVLTGNQTSHGGALHFSGTGTLRMESSTVESNLASDAAVVVRGGATVDIVDSHFSANATSNLMLSGTADASITDSMLEKVVGLTYHSPGPSLRLENAAATTIQNLTVRDNAYGGIAISGSSDVLVTESVIENNGADPLAAGPAIDVAETAVLRLEHSFVRGNHGSGLHASGASRTELRNTAITDNDAYRGGGGVNFEGTPAESPTLVLHEGVSITGNEALPSQQLLVSCGGGLRLVHAQVDALQAHDYLIADNIASGDGGGVCQEGGVSRFGSSAQGAGILRNTAAASGGGIYVLDGRFEMFASGHAAQLALNQAGLNWPGGAMHLLGSTFVGYGVAIDENLAGMGGGVALFESATRGGGFCLGRAEDAGACESFGVELPIAAGPCIACNSISGNEAAYVGGGAALARLHYQNLPLPMRIDGAKILDNVGISLILSAPGLPSISAAPDGDIDVWNSIVAGNTLSDALIEGIPAGLGYPNSSRLAVGRVNLLASTIAGNAVSAEALITTRNSLHIGYSIIQQPDTTVHEGNTTAATATHSLFHSTAGFAFDPTVIQGDAKLETQDGLPVPSLASVAVDFAPAAATATDLFGTPRAVEHGAAPNRFGPRDLGAIERASDVLFSDGFED